MLLAKARLLNDLISAKLVAEIAWLVLADKATVLEDNVAVAAGAIRQSERDSFVAEQSERKR